MWCLSLEALVCCVLLYSELHHPIQSWILKLVVFIEQTAEQAQHAVG
jgi:hypothetical protein